MHTHWVPAWARHAQVAEERDRVAHAMHLCCIRRLGKRPAAERTPEDVRDLQTLLARLPVGMGTRRRGDADGRADAVAVAGMRARRERCAHGSASEGRHQRNALHARVRAEQPG